MHERCFPLVSPSNRMLGMLYEDNGVYIWWLVGMHHFGRWLDQSSTTLPHVRSRFSRVHTRQEHTLPVWNTLFSFVLTTAPNTTPIHPYDRHRLEQYLVPSKDGLSIHIKVHTFFRIEVKSNNQSTRKCQEYMNIALCRPHSHTW